MDAPVVPGRPLLAGPLHVDPLLLLGGHLQAAVDAVPDGLLHRQEVQKTGSEAREEREEREKMDKKVDREKKKKRDRRGTRGRAGTERKGMRVRKVRRGLRMMGISNVDKNNLESSLSSSTSTLEGPVPRPRWWRVALSMSVKT